MHKITTYSSGSGSTKHVHIILNDRPSSKTYAAAVLLHDYYHVRDVDYQSKQKEIEDRINFSRQYLKSELKRLGSLTCYYCSKPNLIIEDYKMIVDPKVKATIDHIIPISKGGHPKDLKNIVTACSKCNTKKGNKTLEEFVKLRQK